MNSRSVLPWKTGFEIELLAPVGKSRRDLADAIAAAASDPSSHQVRRIFYRQSEPSLVDGTPVFENLVLGFEVVDGAGKIIATCVDDLTIRKDLIRETPSLPGWYRILSDEKRILNLILAQCDASASQADCLTPIAELFHTRLQKLDGGFVHCVDAYGYSVAMAASLPGERHRPCELISPPLESDREDWLRSSLDQARNLGFMVPFEAATHIHFDALKLRKVRVFANLVRVLFRHGAALRTLVGTNLNCVRIGSLPLALLDYVNQPDFIKNGWQKALPHLMELGLNKYCDFNLVNIIHDIPGKPTFEVRILPGTIDANLILMWTRLFEAILNWCISDPAGEAPEDFGAFLRLLPMEDNEKTHWLGKLKT